MESQQVSDTSLRGKTKALPTISRLIKRFPAKKNVLLDDNSGIDKTCFHCQGSHRLTKPQNCVTGPSLVLYSFPSDQFSVSELSLAQVSCLCGYHLPGLDPFSHYLSSLSWTGLVAWPTASLWFSESAFISCWMKVL